MRVEVPTAAMMNENSPICARLMLAATEVRIPAPVRKAGIDTPTVLPAITTAERTRMAAQCWRTRPGSMSIPTETMIRARTSIERMMAVV